MKLLTSLFALVGLTSAQSFINAHQQVPLLTTTPEYCNGKLIYLIVLSSCACILIEISN